MQIWMENVKDLQLTYPNKIHLKCFETIIEA